MAQELGYKTVFWSLAYVDWNNDSQPTREEAFAKLIPRIHNGAVILLHSTSKTNAAILDELLTKWEDMGYRIRQSGCVICLSHAHNGASGIPWNERQTPPKKFRGGTHYELQQ